MIRTTSELYAELKGGLHIRATNPIIPDKVDNLISALKSQYKLFFLVVEETSSDIPHLHLLIPGQEKQKIRDILLSLDILKPWTNNEGKEIKGNGLSSMSVIRNRHTVAQYVGKSEKVFVFGVDEKFYEKLLGSSYQKKVEDLAQQITLNENEYFTDEIDFKQFSINYVRIKLNFGHSLTAVKTYLEKQYLRKHRDSDEMILRYLMENDIIDRTWTDEYIPVSRQHLRNIRG